MRPRIALLLAATLVLAGCTGGTGAPPADATTTDRPTSTTTASADDSTDGATDADSTVSGDRTWEFMEFTEPATYTFELRSEDEPEPGTLVWDVTEVDGDTVTVAMTFEMAGQRTETTVAGDRETVRSQLLTTPAGPFLVATWFSPTVGYYEDRELAVGEQWSYSTPQGSASFAVTGRETMAGVECFRSEMRVNESVVYEGCFASDLGLAPYTAYYGEDGTPVLVVELVAYERR